MSSFIFVAGRNDDAARDRAFYLLKKYTSATSLRRAIDLYDGFLRDFEREIRKPENVEISLLGKPIDYGEDLQRFLEYLKPMEYARPLLTNPARRAEALGMLREAIRFSAYIWGRRYEEIGAGDSDSLFYKLGYRWFCYESIGVFGKADLAATLISLMCKTASKNGIKRGVVSLGGTRESRRVMCWTYESIFFDTEPRNSIPPIVFPTHLPPCPPKNEESEGQVWSGQPIPVTGIWEPWPVGPTAGVRCPNYYLAGDTASEYQTEGTDTSEAVRWRLIWKDTRYSSGGIPVEEEDYFLPEPVVIESRVRRAWPGEICPQTGEWFANHLNQKVRVAAGDPMPGPERSPGGNLVIWYLNEQATEPEPELLPEDAVAMLGYNPVIEPKPVYCKSGEACPKTGLWKPIVPAGIRGYESFTRPGNLGMMPLRVQAGARMPNFGAYTDEDEARIVWKWIGEQGEYDHPNAARPS
ncbi:Imm72 family immunity protein [Paraburkholderia sp. SIMBA_030]|uniref:Imm72 family immunity protein n=1 Tax=Paraburkholderia sp. SIMBA_030 TaxID=3085773 RepID=UPI00397A7BE8